MKKLNLFLLICTLTFFFSTGIAQDNSIRATSNVRSAQYPHILPDGRAIFRLKLPMHRRYNSILVKNMTW